MGWVMGVEGSPIPLVGKWAKRGIRSDVAGCSFCLQPPVFSDGFLRASARAVRFGAMRSFVFVVAAFTWVMAAMAVHASPWTPVDDAQLRSDIEILANAGLIDGVLAQWPLPWRGLLARLRAAKDLGRQPAYVAAAARRVLARGKEEAGAQSLRAEIALQVTNDPSFVRGFAATAREKAQMQFSAEMALSPSTELRLAVGLQSGSTFKPLPPPGTTPSFDPVTGYASGYFLDDRPDHQTLVFDGSYLAQKVGNSIVYAGYLPHWWGPGWISSLMESTNARPFPQIGITRNSTEAFEWPVLRWLGPWQAEFLVGVLDGPGVTQNILTDSFRLAINPLPGLELGFSRTQLLCGTDHPCKPLVTFFQVQHSAANPDNGNSAGQFDIRYSGKIAAIPFSLYTQFMFMDAGRPTPIGVSSLFGASVWIPSGDHTWRLTAEVTSSESAYNLFTFGDILHGDAYNGTKYLSGYRYRGRSLGFSLDSDSDLISLQASTLDNNGRGFTFTYHRANVSNDCNIAGCALQIYGNVVTTAPVTIDMLDAGITLPFRGMAVGVTARLQDDQPRPQRGFTGGVELSLKRSL